MTKQIDLSETVIVKHNTSDNKDRKIIMKYELTKADILKKAIPIMEDIAWDLLQKNDQARTGSEVDAFLSYCQSLLEEEQS